MARPSLLRLTSLLAMSVVAGCVPAPAPPPQPAATAPVPVPAPAPVAGWRDQPLTAGAWVYLVDPAGSSALFGRAGGEAEFILRCETATRRILLSRPGTVATRLRIATTAREADYAAQVVPGAAPRIGVGLPAADPMLDAIAFSKGRFAVIAAGLPTLVLPAWGEPIRVVEDCRG